MSTYLSLIEPNQAPQLLCARGMLIPLNRKQSGPGENILSPFEINYDHQRQAELFIVAADAGWATFPQAPACCPQLYPYGVAQSIPGHVGISLMLSRLDPELNLTGSLEERSASPVAKLRVSMHGYVHTTMLRSGDAIPLGGALFPLPYLELVTKCRLEVISSDKIRLIPNDATYVDNSAIPSECIVERRSSAMRLSGDGWLVELQFLPYTVDTSFHGTHLSHPPGHAY